MNAITEPGVYDMPDEDYHRDPVAGGSLSASGARRILPPSCPALFHYWRSQGQPPKAEFDFGHAAHQKVLGTGPQIVVVDRERWDTKAVKEEVAAIRAAGNVPLKPHDAATVDAMAAALQAHPFAAALIEAGRGKPEQTLIWRDEPTGVMRRARLDWVPASVGGRLLLADYKTSTAADPDHIERAVHSYGYHIQAAWYLDGAAALGLGDAAFLFIFQMKTPPYLVTVAELDATTLRIGRELGRQALETYAECTASGHWPGFDLGDGRTTTDDIAYISLPIWAQRQHEGVVIW